MPEGKAQNRDVLVGLEAFSLLQPQLAPQVGTQARAGAAPREKHLCERYLARHRVQGQSTQRTVTPHCKPRAQTGQGWDPRHPVAPAEALGPSPCPPRALGCLLLRGCQQDGSGCPQKRGTSQLSFPKTQGPPAGLSGHRTLQPSPTTPQGRMPGLRGGGSPRSPGQ